MRSIVLQIDEKLRMHDFRLKSEQILQFDLVIPDDFHLTDTELIDLLQQAVHEKIGTYGLDVTLDHNYLL
jgi:predicted protein tyrosine phosphatase